MTLEELFSVQTDQNKLKSLYIELANLEDFNPYKKNTVSDMPRGGEGKDFTTWYTEEKDRIEAEIDYYKKKLIEDRRMVDAYINAAPYPECDIIRYRVINYLGWNDIGAILGYHRSAVSKKFYEYIKHSHNSHISHA